MTTAHYTDEAVRLYHGDCIEVMRQLPDASVDAVVTDPPYELTSGGAGGFMGKAWDGTGIAFRPEVWIEALRVLKPGGHLLAFGGTRTWHRLACAIEDAGFEVRDSIAWMYGSGFPKSLDVSKAMDKRRDDRDDVLRVTGEIAALRDAAGLTNRDLDALFGFAGMAGHWTSTKSQPTVPTVEQWGVLRDALHAPEWMDAEVWRLNGRKGTPGEAWDQREVVGQRDGNLLAVAPGQDNDRSATTLDITAPATPLAKTWQGWGTALKPAFEPVVVARKPLIGTVAANVERYGTGALNIDASRIEHTGTENMDAKQAPSSSTFSAAASDWTTSTYKESGRWPANVILDESQAEALDRQSGDRPGSSTASKTSLGSGEKSETHGWGGTIVSQYGDTGGASRFFYTAKADSSERPRVDGVAHPTVKPLSLMRYLVTLVCPPGGTVLEPFAGSGTTLEACIVEGFRCIGIEREADYIPLIMARITKPIEVTLL